MAAQQPQQQQQYGPLAPPPALLPQGLAIRRILTQPTVPVCHTTSHLGNAFDAFVSVLITSGNRYAALLRCLLHRERATRSLMSILPSDIIACTCIATSPNLLLPDTEDALGSDIYWILTVMANGQHRLELGQIRTRNATLRGILLIPHGSGYLPIEQVEVSALPILPVTFRPAPVPEEQALLAIVLEVLQDPTVNPRRGSLGLTTLQTVLMQRYAEIVHLGLDVPNRYPPSQTGLSLRGKMPWSLDEFLRRHEDKFSVFSVSARELERRYLRGNVSAEEPRVALRAQAKKGSSTDLDHMPREIVDEIFRTLYFLLSQRTFVMKDLMTALRDRRLLRRLCPAFSILMRFLQRKRDLFRWTTDPTQPTRLGLLGTDEGVNAPTSEAPKEDIGEENKERS